MKQPSHTDTAVKVRAYLTDEMFGYEHWRAAQFSAPVDARPAILLLFVNEAARGEALEQLK